MTKRYSRAQRRHDRMRLRIKRQYHWGYGRKQFASKIDKRGDINVMSPNTAGTVLDTPAPCSCYMCCNPRRYGELTIQELKAIANFSTQIGDYDEKEI